MNKIIKEKGNYVLVNHDRKTIISAITENMISDKLTVYLQPGDDVIECMLEDIVKRYPDYVLSDNLKKDIKKNNDKFFDAL